MANGIWGNLLILGMHLHPVHPHPPAYATGPVDVFSIRGECRRLQSNVTNGE